MDTGIALGIVTILPLLSWLIVRVLTYRRAERDKNEIVVAMKPSKQAISLVAAGAAYLILLLALYWYGLRSGLSHETFVTGELTHFFLLLFPVWLLASNAMPRKDLGFVSLRSISLSGDQGFAVLLVLFCFIFPILGTVIRAFSFALPIQVGLGVSPSPLYFVIAITLVPLSEELFFRGFLQGRLLQLIPRHEYLPVVIGGIAYALFHVPKVLYCPEYLSGVFFPDVFYASPVIFVAMFFVLGSLFGYIYKLSGCIWVPVFAHALYNVTCLLFRA